MTARKTDTRRTHARGHGRSTEACLADISGSVAVVGNGRLACRFGSLIDACDAVIRFNDFVIAGHEPWCGRKVTHWCTFGETPGRPLPRRHRAGLQPLSPYTEDAPESAGIVPAFRSRMTFVGSPGTELEFAL